MQTRVATIFVSLALIWLAGAAPSDGDLLFTQYTTASFRKLPAANQVIDPEKVNKALLDAAVFHETNRRRAMEKLKPLRHHAKAREAAAIQSRSMAETGVVRHENPQPNASVPSDRAQLAGLARPAFLAENVASTFARRYRSGVKFYVREEDGREIYSAEPNGPPIPLHTYLTFATTLVDSWMVSLGHRNNIMAPEAEYLGCSCIRGEKRTAMDTYYCTQVFYRPLD